MVPTLKVPNEAFLDYGYINAFIKDLSRDIQYEDVVYVLLKPKNMDAFRLFLESEYDRTENIIEDYDYDGGFVVLVYKLNPELKEDFELIKQGKYSKTSEKFKSQFPKVKKITIAGLRRDELSTQWRIFRKTTDLKEHWEEKLGVSFNDELEVWEGFHEERETLDIENIKSILCTTNK